jgi:hypothetical protein
MGNSLPKCTSSVVLQDNESFPDVEQFVKLFPNVDVKNVKQEGMFKGSGLHFVDKTTGVNYAYGGGHGWRQLYVLGGD